MITTILNILVLVLAVASLTVSVRFYLQTRRDYAAALVLQKQAEKNLSEAQRLSDELARQQTERLRKGLL